MNLVETMRSFNEILIKAQEDKNQINATTLQSITYIQKKVHLGSNPSHVEVTSNAKSHSKNCARKKYQSLHKGSCNKTHGIFMSRSFTKGSSDSPHSNGHAKCSPKGSHHRNTYKGVSRGEFRKARPPTFNGRDKACPNAEAWLLGMEQYFKIHD